MSDVEELFPPWAGPGYWPPSPAVIPSPTHQRRGVNNTCYPGERRVYAENGDFWCESANFMRPRRFAGLEDLRDLGETTYTGADLVKQLIFAHEKGNEYKTKIADLFNKKALTNATYLLYRQWVSNHVKLRQDLTDLMRKNPKLADAVATKLGVTRDQAIAKVESMSIPNIVYTAKESTAFGVGSFRFRNLGGLENFGILPAVALGIAAIVGLAASYTISRIASQDLEVARENTRRLDLVIKSAEEISKTLPPEQRIAALKAAVGSAATAFTPPEPSFFDKLKTAVAGPIGLAIGAGVVYLGAVKVVLPYMRKKQAERQAP